MLFKCNRADRIFTEFKVSTMFRRYTFNHRLLFQLTYLSAIPYFHTFSPSNRSISRGISSSIDIYRRTGIDYAVGWPFDRINVDKYRLPLNKYRLEGRIYVNLCPLHYAKAIARYRFERGNDKLRILCLPISVALSDKHRARSNRMCERTSERGQASSRCIYSADRRVYLSSAANEQSLPVNIRLEHTSKGLRRSAMLDRRA